LPEPSPGILFFLARAFPCGLLSQHFKDHRQSLFPFVDIAKLRTKKTQTKHFNETTWMAKKTFGQQ
jgi:hypothetical protein